MSWQKIGLAVFAMMIFGLNAVLSKIGLKEFPPLTFNLLRFAVILPALVFIPRPAISWAQLAAIAFSLSIGHLMFASLGLYLGVSAGTFAFIQQTGPIFAIICAYLLMNHKPGVYDLIGLVLGLVGVVWICSSKEIQGGLIAIACVVISAALWGLGFTLVKKMHAPSIPTNAWTAVFVIPCMLIISFFYEGLDSMPAYIANASAIAWAMVFFSGWVSLIAAGGILMYLMRTEKVAKVAPFNMLVPVFGCCFSYLLLDEHLGLNILIGGAWIIAGLIVTQFGSKIITYFRAPDEVNAETAKII